MTVRKWSIYCLTDGAVCKVGMTQNAEKRLQSARTHSGIAALRLVKVWPLGCSRRKDGSSVEYAVHLTLKRDVAPPLGEWYITAPDRVVSVLDVHIPRIIRRKRADRREVARILAARQRAAVTS